MSFSTNDSVAAAAGLAAIFRNVHELITRMATCCSSRRAAGHFLRCSRCHHLGADDRPRIVVLMSLLLVTCVAKVTADTGHWLRLHDGETNFGWQPTSNANWTITSDAIHVSTGDPGWLRTNTVFADFELQLDYMADANTNSGVFFRMSALPEDPTADCYEVNIAADNPFPTASLVGRQKSLGSPNGDSTWHTMLIRADGASIQVSVDGRRLCNYTDPHPIPSGHIGLQFNQGAVKFRNIKLRPLNLNPLIGADLSGWIIHPEMTGGFEIVTPGTMSVQGGPGQIETEATFGNFVLQTECRTNAAGLNSGVFFRSIPGDRSMGYESQIDNTIKEGTEDSPANCGTGGIFRRVDARRIVAKDLEWFRKTVVAHDNHFAVWVNGYQVTDWTDERPPDENPRRGLRLKPGSIILQAHDPTTDIEFRKMRCSEISPP